jgi:hypothetical protein
MKKIFFLIFFTLAAYSFAFEFPNRTIFIEGTAEQPAHRTFFMQNFIMEAHAKNLNVTENRRQAGYIVRFDVQSYRDVFNPSFNYLIRMSLINNETSAEMVSFGWPFVDLEDMYEFNQFLFYNTVVFIPGIDEDELVNWALTTAVDNRWQNQFVYIRGSLDYPISFFALQPTGLIAGQAAYIGTFEDPGNLQHMGHLIMPQPGLTIGGEVQFLDFLSAELNFQARMGDPKTYLFFNMAAGVQLKYNFKIRHFMFQPYAAYARTFNISPEFTEFASNAVGGGLQVSIRGGQTQSFFIDVNYMLSLGDIFRRNPFGELAPLPEQIHYKRFAFGIGVGYKFGLIDR